MQLSHAEVGFRELLQGFIAVSARIARSAMLAISPVAVTYMLVTGGNGVANNQIAPATATAAITVSLLRILFARYANASLRLAQLFRMDYCCHDIPIDEEERCRGSRMPRQNIRIDSWTEQECYDFTSFTGDQLRRIFGLFGLAQLAAQTDGYIRVFTGHEYYRCDPEEIFLLMLTKCRTGKSNRELCDLVFGGNSSRWSFGYPWILVYLDTRYARTISHEKLCDFVDEFPAFYDAINRFIQKPTVHHFNDGSAEECNGLNFLPFSIFGFIDCSIDRISRPFSGPDGDYIGAPRKAMHHAAQRSVYTGYKKCHGIKFETVLLPNGISTVKQVLPGRDSNSMVPPCWCTKVCSSVRPRPVPSARPSVPWHAMQLAAHSFTCKAAGSKAGACAQAPNGQATAPISAMRRPFIAHSRGRSIKRWWFLAM